MLHPLAHSFQINKSIVVPIETAEREKQKITLHFIIVYIDDKSYYISICLFSSIKKKTTQEITIYVTLISIKLIYMYIVHTVTRKR